MKKLIAHIDCNNFYASCERIFNPSLHGKPLLILSNNDGCVVARSDEAKSLGIGMGVPYFKIRKIIDENDVRVYSSNYTLYGDISQRVMNVLSQYTPSIEFYSIDEAFLSFDKIRTGSLNELAGTIRKSVLRKIGVPVSIGIAPTKTLAKIANEFVKKNPRLNGIFDITSLKNTDALLKQVPVHDVWGIGSQHGKMLFRNNIFTAFDFRNTDQNLIKKTMGVTGLRTCLELKGISCIDMEETLKPKKGIMSSRSFGRYVTELGEIREAVSQYVTRAAEKLRRQNSVCRSIYVFIQTNHHKLSDMQYSTGRSVTFSEPTAFTPLLINNANFVLDKIFKHGFNYIKAGVYLSDIYPDDNLQLSAFEKNDHSKQKEIMRAVDAINYTWGRDTVKYASAGIAQNWKMKMNFVSRRYTTNWNELLTVNI